MGFDSNLSESKIMEDNFGVYKYLTAVNQNLKLIIIFEF
jgi:hypothetical protein